LPFTIRRMATSPDRLPFTIRRMATSPDRFPLCKRGIEGDFYIGGTTASLNSLRSTLFFDYKYHD
jgi:hypothetical protein